VADDKTLREMKERYQDGDQFWSETREAGRECMKALTREGTWSAAERKARELAGRPCLSLDELGQHVNQLINEVRANKRAIKISPTGNGANDELAEFRASLIREIEYKSHAQMAYTRMFEDAVQRSYGFLRVTTGYVQDQVGAAPEPALFDQEIRIEPVWNPELVTIDPLSQRSDCSDMLWAIVREKWLLADFKRDFPKARAVDFEAEHDAQTRLWLDGPKSIYVGEYWTVSTTPKKVVALRRVGTEEIAGVFDAYTVQDADLAMAGLEVARERTVDERTVTQRLTNGLEILDEKPWPGRYIPLVGCFGKILYVSDGTSTKRLLQALTSLALDPQQLYNYYKTTEAETIGMVPKAPYMVAAGALTPDQWTALQKSYSEPVAGIEYTAFDDSGRPLPPPMRQPYDPPVQQLGFGAEGARRGIQASVGASPLPTSAQRLNEKSGVALRQIEQSTQRGSFHFIDHYEDAIRQTGVIINDLIPAIYDTPREVGIRKPDDSPAVVTINDPQQPEAVDARAGTFEVTISTGPSFDSERQQVSEFVDALIGSPVFGMIAQLVGPKPAAAILSKAIKMKNLGLAGDEMADILMPLEYKSEDGEAPLPPEVQAQLQQAQQAMEAMQGEIQRLQQVLQTQQVKEQAQTERATLEAQSRQQVEQVKAMLAEALQAMKGEQALALEAAKQQHANQDREDQQAHELALAAAQLAVPVPFPQDDAPA